MPRNATYTHLDRRRAASLYVIHASSLRVADETGIPARTIRTWTTTEWWTNFVSEAQSAMDVQLDALYTEMIHLAGKKARERLEQGDCRIGKDGQLVYVPVSARDAATVGGIAYDKRSLLRNRPKAITAETAKDRLEMLVAKFSEISETHTQQIPTVSDGNGDSSID